MQELLFTMFWYDFGRVSLSQKPFQPLNYEQLYTVETKRKQNGDIINPSGRNLYLKLLSGAWFKFLFVRTDRQDRAAHSGPVCRHRRWGWSYKAGDATSVPESIFSGALLPAEFFRDACAGRLQMACFSPSRFSHFQNLKINSPFNLISRSL